MKTESYSREDSYNEMMTRLFDAIKTEADLCTLPPGCSLLAELDQVKERYQDQHYIAGGGMKKIFKVMDKMTDRHVAMAVMHKLKAPEVVEQFIHEARVNARLEHPNIMPVYDIGLDEEGEPFFTMKLVTGDNLGTILKKLGSGDPAYAQQYDLSRLLDIFSRICDAVAYAHSRGVLHLDLKPENIQIGSYGEVLVCDWGLSRYQEISLENMEVRDAQGSLLTNIGNVCGTPGYMSPEQVTEKRKDLTGKADIYALGSILYSILTLKRPLDTPNTEDILSATVAGRIPLPSERAPERNIPSALEAVALHAMAVDPSARYATAEELKDDIFAYIKGYATSAENAGFMRMLMLLIKRHRTTSFIIAAALITVTSLTTFFIFELKKSKELAEANELAALDNLEKLKKEQEIRRRLGESATPAMTEKVEKELVQYDPKAWDSIKEALEVNPDGRLLKRFRGGMLLGNHQFNEALAYFENDDSDGAQVYTSLLTSFAESKRQGVSLNHDQIAALIEQLNKDRLNFASVAFLQNARGSFESLDQRAAFTRRLLNIVNPSIDTLSFNYDPQHHGTFRVDLSNNPELKDISVLMLLPIQNLNLSGTAVEDIMPLGQLPLEHLDLSDTKVAYLTGLASCPLKSLDISRTPVKDITPLRQLPLEILRMSNTTVSDFAPLADIKRLQLLVVSYSETNILHLREAMIPDRIRILLK